MKARRVRSMAAALIAALALAGCASLPEPDGPDRALLIGMIVHEGSGYPSYGNATVNGERSFGIELTVENLGSGEKATLRAGQGGLFLSAKLPPGEYRLDKFYLKVSSGNSWADVALEGMRGDRRFSILPGAVNNLGCIYWNGDGQRGAQRYYLNRDYPKARAAFSERFADSAWLALEEIPVNVWNDEDEGGKQ